MTAKITEDLLASDYRFTMRKRSKIDPSVFVECDEYYQCPHCKKRMHLLEHGDTVKCRCGLEVTLQGNNFHCVL